MAGRCEGCGNDDAQAFHVVTAGVTHRSDSFERASARLAPGCERGGVEVAGHGMERAGAFFCCARGARAEGQGRLVNGAAHPPAHQPLRQAGCATGE